MEKQLSQQQIWENLAKPWSEYKQEPLKEVADFLKNKSGNILDLGCGSGRHLVKLKDSIFYCLDFSKNMLEFAKKNAKKNKIKAEFIQSPAEKIKANDNFFDSAIYIATLHCIPNIKDRQKSLKELYRVSKNNAQCLISVWSKNHLRLKNKPKNAFIPWTYKNKKYQRYYYLYDKDELKQELIKAKFKIISIIEDNKSIIAIVKK